VTVTLPKRRWRPYRAAVVALALWIGKEAAGNLIIEGARHVLHLARRLRASTA
jgi:hypothetical protein